MSITFDLIPWHALTGGFVIGIAATLLLFFDGRIAGIFGILGGLYRVRKGDISWRVAFIFGLIVSAVIWKLFFDIPPIQIETSHVMLALAGLLVGYGIRLGSGCTSGHGVCGLSRRSPRSIAATAVFMLTGFAVVYLLRHVFV